MIYNYTRKLYGDKQSLLSVFFLVSSLLTISEIHQAKTDGVLFLTVVVCNLLILKGINKSFLAFKEKIIFWLFLSTGILIKGPIIIIFTLLPLTIISILRKENLVNIIWSKAGLLVFALVCIPWYVAITIVSDGLFWHESLINDLFNKVKSGQESHGFPPGYYLLLLSIMFWPGVIFLPILIKKISQDWKLKFLEKKEELFIFLWLIIPFVIYEIIPTKLPHYIFPSYAALSILISNLVKKKYLTGKTYKFICFLMLFFPFLFLGSKIFVLNEYSTIDYTLLVIIPFFLVLILFQIFWFLKNILGLIISTFIFQSLVYLSAVYYLIPRLDKLWVSEKINTVISQNYYQVDKVLHFGFNEPSLIFLLHTSQKKFKRI